MSDLLSYATLKFCTVDSPDSISVKKMSLKLKRHVVMTQFADDVAQALADGNKGRATSQLRNMQRRIAEDARDKDIDLDFAQRLLDSIDAVARAYDLKLPDVKLKN